MEQEDLDKKPDDISWFEWEAIKARKELNSILAEVRPSITDWTLFSLAKWVRLYVQHLKEEINTLKGKTTSNPEGNGFWIVTINTDSTEFGLFGSESQAKLMFDTDGKPMTVIDTFPMSEYDYDAAKARYEKLMIEHRAG